MSGETQQEPIPEPRASHEMHVVILRVDESRSLRRFTYVRGFRRKVGRPDCINELTIIYLLQSFPTIALMHLIAER